MNSLGFRSDTNCARMHLSSNGRFRATYLDRRECSNQHPVVCPSRLREVVVESNSGCEQSRDPNAADRAAVQQDLPKVLWSSFG